MTAITASISTKKEKRKKKLGNICNAHLFGEQKE